MQVQLNYKNALVAMLALFMLYLFYTLFVSGGEQWHLPTGISVDLRELATYCVIAAESGGHAVRMVHDEKKLQAAIKAQTKEGANEFVTRADLISNKLIVDLLSKYPGLKVVSEEHSADFTEKEVAPYKAEKYELWKKREEALEKVPQQAISLDDLTIWVDPLDATQEFTEDLTEYVTVMLCATVRGRPVFGAIYRPFADEIVFGMEYQGRSVVYSSGYEVHLPPPDTANVAVVSRSHAGTVGQLLQRAFTGAAAPKVEPAGGSGYKSLRVLNGTAAMYVHKTAIKKWDVCAGDAIIRAAGGRMLTLQGNELSYFEGDDKANEAGLLVAIHHPFALVNKLKDNA